MTTKLAEFLGLEFVYSCTTSRFLLLTLGFSDIDSSATPSEAPLSAALFLLVALVCGGFEFFGPAEAISRTRNQPLERVEPFELCAFRTTSSGLGPAKASNLVKFWPYAGKKCKFGEMRGFSGFEAGPVVKSMEAK